MKSNKINSDEELLLLSNRAYMKFEDFRSNELRNHDLIGFDTSELHSPLEGYNRNADLEPKKITLQELYDLYTQLKHLIYSIETYKTNTGQLVFAGLLINLQIYEIEMPPKEICVAQFLENAFQIKDDIEKQQNSILERNKTMNFPNELLNKFCFSLENNLLDSYIDKGYQFDVINNPNKKTSNIYFPGKNLALIELDYKNLKIHHKKCENINQTLQ